MSLAGKICVVTGATRGLGKGIALQLGEHGATVYITGRTLDSQKGSDAGGSLRETAEAIAGRGGVCIPVQCDHSKDEEVQRLFDQISREQEGRLDVLVNNAYSAVQALTIASGKKFWEQPVSMWDTVNNVGLRNHYICTTLAAKLMVPRKQGLIVNVSSAGGLFYMIHVAYGVGKEAVDRMAVDCGIEMKKHNVACLSLWTGGVHTEMIDKMIKDRTKEAPDKPINEREETMAKYFLQGESTEYIGKCVVNLAKDPNIMKKTASVHISMDLGAEYGFVDIDGRRPMHIRQVNTLVWFSPKWRWLSRWIPDFVKIPKWVMHLSGNKFY